MEKTEFLTIFPTFEKLEVAKETLPSIIEETNRNDAKLIVHDSSVKGRARKWNYLQKLFKYKQKKWFDYNINFIIDSWSLKMINESEFTENFSVTLNNQTYKKNGIIYADQLHIGDNLRVDSVKNSRTQISGNLIHGDLAVADRISESYKVNIMATGLAITYAPMLAWANPS